MGDTVAVVSGLLVTVTVSEKFWTGWPCALKAANFTVTGTPTCAWYGTKSANCVATAGLTTLVVAVAIGSVVFVVSVAVKVWEPVLSNVTVKVAIP